MKRNIKTIIAVGVLLVVLIGAYFGVTKLKKKTAPPAQTALPEVHYIITEKIEDILYIQYNAGEVNYTIYNEETPTIEGYKSHIIDTSILKSALSSAVGSTFDREMGVKEDLSKFGLDTEDKFILFKTKDGKEYKLIIGNPTYIGNEHYARMVDSNEVYTISSAVSNLLLCHPENYRSYTVCNVEGEIKEFSVGQNGRKVLEVLMDAEYARANGFTQSNYIIKYPYSDVEANQDVIGVLLESVSSVVATEIVEEDPKNLSKYGLDKPNSFTCYDGKTTSTVKMGSYTPDGLVYVMKDDIPVVFTAYCSFYESIRNLNADEFLARYIHLFNIKKVKNVLIENADESHTMSITPKSGDTYEYRIDGNIKVEENFTKAYEVVIKPIASRLASGESITGEEKCKITFTMTDGSVKTFVYHAYDDSHYIVKASNGLVCIVKKESIDEIFSTL